MISYLEAKVVPLVSSSVGASMVLVAGISFDERSGVAQLLQKCAASVLSESHLGHYIPIIPSD